MSNFKDLLATLYILWVLDCIVDLAYAVSKDFSARLQLYQNVKPDTVKLLAKINGFYDHHPDFPGPEIRATLYRPIFGELGSDWQGGGNDRSRVYLLAAAVALAENYTATPQLGDASLIEAVRSASLPFRTRLLELEGCGFESTYNRVTNIFETAESILKDPGIAGVFGVAAIKDPDWPRKPDSNGARLVHQIRSQLPDIPGGLIKPDEFIQKQRMADQGHKSIVGILDPEIDTDDAKLLQVNTHLYAWARELGLMIGQATPPA